MNRFFITICFLLLLVTAVRAQSPSAKDRATLMSMQDSLKNLSFKIVNDSIEPARYNANYQFIKVLVDALKTPYSFNFPFDSLRALSIQTSPDKRFRIFSWHVMNANGTYRYYGTIQMNKPDGKLEMFPLVDYSSSFKNATDTITSNDRWYGAQYYRIMSVLDNVKTPYYVLLGWKGNSLQTTKKVIDVLHFKDGKAHFGMQVFDGNKDNPTAKRIIFEYTRKASMVLNYEPSIRTIVFDHLAPPNENLRGKYELYGPDFSYDGYKISNGRWKLVEDLELKNQPTEQDDDFNDPRKLSGAIR